MSGQNATPVQAIKANFLLGTFCVLFIFLVRNPQTQDRQKRQGGDLSSQAPQLVAARHALSLLASSSTTVVCSNVPRVRLQGPALKLSLQTAPSIANNQKSLSTHHEERKLVPSLRRQAQSLSKVLFCGNQHTSQVNSCSTTLMGLLLVRSLIHELERE